MQSASFHSNSTPDVTAPSDDMSRTGGYTAEMRRVWCCAPPCATRRPEAAAAVGHHAVSCSVTAPPAAAASAPAPQHAGDGAGAGDAETGPADAEGPAAAREFSVTRVTVSCGHIWEVEVNRLT